MAPGLTVIWALGEPNAQLWRVLRRSLEKGFVNWVCWVMPEGGK